MDDTRGWQGALKKNTSEHPRPAPTIEEITKILNDRSDDVTLTREQLISRITEYFLSCTEIVEDPDTGESKTNWIKPPTKSGLATAIGISKDRLIDYKRGWYDGGAGRGICTYTKDNKNMKVSIHDFDVIRKAIQIVEAFYEEQLTNGKNPAGSIFWLQNLTEKHWTNDHSVKIEAAPEQRKQMTLADLPHYALEKGREQPEGLPDFGFDDDDEDTPFDHAADTINLAKIGRPQGHTLKRIGDDDEQ